MYKDTNNDSLSSSILDKEHLKYHSYIEFEKDNEIINVDTLDSFNINNANILCIDVQG